MNKYPIVFALVIIASLGISIGFSYAIATSDLPFWFKFWMLR